MAFPRLAGVVGCLLVLLTGCLTTEEAELIRSDIRRLQREVRLLRDEEGQQKRTVESAVDPVAGRVENLRKELQEVRRLQADFESRLLSTQEAAAKATGATEERRFRAQRIEKERQELKEALEGRLAALEKELALVKNNLGFKGPTAVSPTTPSPERPAAPSVPSAGPPRPPPAARPKSASPISPPTVPVLPPTPTAPPPAVAPPPGVAEDVRAHTQAAALIQAKKLGEARQKFQEFLRRFPTSPLADDAQYGIGETYYQEKRYDKAILEFDKVVINYAKGDKVPSALLKQGFAFLALGDKESAKQLLTQLVTEFPNSEEAKTARSRLSNL